jgi:hypothetical protein
LYQESCKAFSALRWPPGKKSGKKSKTYTRVDYGTLSNTWKMRCGDALRMQFVMSPSSK